MTGPATVIGSVLKPVCSFEEVHPELPLVPLWVRPRPPAPSVGAHGLIAGSEGRPGQNRLVGETSPLVCGCEGSLQRIPGLAVHGNVFAARREGCNFAQSVGCALHSVARTSEPGRRFLSTLDDEYHGDDQRGGTKQSHRHKQPPTSASDHRQGPYAAKPGGRR